MEDLQQGLRKAKWEKRQKTKTEIVSMVLDVAIIFVLSTIILTITYFIFRYKQGV